ncbi:MAG: bifunctional hydroxymethylpyrimidine kinase/phosphomethylpyrimidine kinase [Desulfatibacillum sp.]|nr:bifunctional hydroxymethylpyrimidine kinase/phosphomethylpyrimidine kinase [Desulfatibacillum sp.]
MSDSDIPIVLSIAGSDSGAGAGIQADLKTLTALGVYGTTAITAITAQNTLGVSDWWEVPPDMVAAQIRAVVSDMGADAVKTGMLGGPETVRVVAREIRELGLKNVVVDPVMKAKGGKALLLPESRKVLVEDLFPLARVVTPNLDEASELLGRVVNDLSLMKEAARAIHGMGADFVVVKGGHLDGEPYDLLFDGRDFFEFSGKRFSTPHSHGTGCTFASAIAAGLAHGMEVREAVFRAKEFITRAIRHGLPLGKGHGPVNHFPDLLGEGEYK